MSEWQPIETAPKDTDVLVYRMGPHGALPATVAGLFHNGEDAGWCSFDDIDKWIDGTPTHWMPLPPAPATSA